MSLACGLAHLIANWKTLKVKKGILLIQYTGFYVFKVFSAFKMTKSKKQGPFQRNKDPIGTLIGKKVPIGTRVPKQGPNWQQWFQGGTLLKDRLYVTALFQATDTVYSGRHRGALAQAALESRTNSDMVGGICGGRSLLLVSDHQREVGINGELFSELVKYTSITILPVSLFSWSIKTGKRLWSAW